MEIDREFEPGDHAFVTISFNGETITNFVMWKLMIPLMLKGYDPILLSFAAVVVLSAAILFLVAGLNKKGVVALLGASIGQRKYCTPLPAVSGLSL